MPAWLDAVLSDPPPRTPADATAVARSRAPETLSELLARWGHAGRQAAGGVAEGVAQVPGQLTDLARFAAPPSLPPSVMKLAATPDAAGPRTRTPSRIPAEIGDLVGGPATTVSDSTFRGIGNVAGNLAGWELGARSGLLGKLTPSLRTKEVAEPEKIFHPNGQWGVITKSPAEPGKYRFTWFSGEGENPLGHIVGRSPSQLTKTAAERGFDLPQPPRAFLPEEDAARLGDLEEAHAAGEYPLSKDELTALTQLQEKERRFAVHGANTPPADWTPDQLEAFGQQHGVPGLGRVSPPHEVTLTDGSKVNVPGGTEGTFSYHDLLQLKAQGINPNLLPEGLHDQIHAKIMRTMTPEHMTDEEMFRSLVFGITSPNSPLTPNEFTVSRFMPQSMDDIRKLAKMNPKDVPHAFGVDAAKKGGLGTAGSVDYANVVKLAQLFEKNPKWFRRAADEPWDQYVDRISTQIPGLGSKTASLAGVWQDLPNAAVSAVDRHMAELAMPHILDHPELGPDFRARVVKSWNNQENLPVADRVKTLEQIRERDPIFVRDFLASLINSPTHANFRTAKGALGKNVPPEMGLLQWIEEPEKTTQMNPYYREALKYNAGHQRPGESLFASQWRLWDKQRGRIEPHEVMFPGLNRLPRMDLEDARAAYKAHKAARYTLGKPTALHPAAVGGQLPAVRRVMNPMSLGYWGLGGAALGGGLLSDESPPPGPRGLLAH